MTQTHDTPPAMPDDAMTQTHDTSPAMPDDTRAQVQHDLGMHRLGKPLDAPHRLTELPHRPQRGEKSPKGL